MQHTKTTHRKNGNTSRKHKGDNGNASRKHQVRKEPHQEQIKKGIASRNGAERKGTHQENTQK